MVTLDGLKIARLRIGRGLTSQQMLAEKTREVDTHGAGVSPRVIWSAENSRPVSHRTHFLIANALDVKPADLLPQPLPLRLKQLLRTRAGIIAASLTALAAIGATAALLMSPGVGHVSAVRRIAGDPPVAIASVRFTGANENYTMTILGSGFGASPFRRPFYGTAPYFHIADITQRFEAGYPGDNEKLRFEHWSDRRVVVADVQATQGDCIGVMLWNPITHAGAAWGGNIPPVVPGTPQILSAGFSADGRITLIGSDFGKAPFALPYSSNDNFVRVADAAYHPWGNGPSVPFDVGGKWMNTKLRFTHWSNGRIAIAGFTGAPIPEGMTIEPGDPVAVVVWNPQAHLATAWGGVATR